MQKKKEEHHRVTIGKHNLRISPSLIRMLLRARNARINITRKRLSALRETNPPRRATFDEF